MTLALRPYQLEAVESVFSCWDNGDRNLLVSSPTGSGKSIIISEIVRRLVEGWPGIKVIVVTDSRELIVQNQMALKRYAPNIISGTFSAGLNKRQTRPNIIFCGIQSVYKRAYDFGKVDIVLTDECFPYDTDIITDSGIMKIGDIVENKLNVRVLTHTGEFKKISNYTKKSKPSTMALVVHENGEFECTPNHKILTNRGWVEAKDLNIGDYIYLKNGTQYQRTPKQSFESKMGETHFGTTPYKCNSSTGKKECTPSQNNHFEKTGTVDIGKFDGGYGNTLYESNQPISKTYDPTLFTAVRVCRLEIRDTRTTMPNPPAPGEKWGMGRYELCFQYKIPTMFKGNLRYCKNGWKNKIYARVVRSNNRSDCSDILVSRRWFYNNEGTEYQYIDGAYNTRRRHSCSNVVTRQVGNRIKNISLSKRISRWNIQKRGCCSTWRDIERIEIHSPNTDVQSSVYDLEVEGNHTYTANGIIVHNCHMISRKSESRYVRFFKDLETANPSVCHVGFSATIWRTDTGLLHEGEGAMFKKIAYACDMKQLIKEGWLVPLISKSGSSKIDLTNVHIRNHEYDQKDLAFAADNEILVKLAVEEIVKCGKDRKSWLVFASSVLHAQHIKQEFKKHGVDCEIVTGDTPKEERDRIVGDFRNGKSKCLVNVSVFIKGFDVPRVDLLALMTSTQSTGKFVQACGRGMRPFTDQNGVKKESCLLLDFGTNVQRLGMIDDIDPVQTKTVFNTVKSPPPIKECPKCFALIHARIIKCPSCGYDFGIDKDDSVLNHGAEAYSGPVMVDQQTPFLIDVKQMWVSKHAKPGKTPSVKIAFYDNLDKETAVWACLDHKGYSAEKAQALIKQLGGKAKTVDEALQEWPAWRKVEKVQVKYEGKWPRITGFVFAKGQSTQYKLDGEYK